MLQAAMDVTGTSKVNRNTESGPGKQDTVEQCCFNVGPVSKTVCQR